MSLIPRQPDSVSAVLQWGADQLQSGGIASPRLEAELLLADAMAVRREQLHANDRNGVPTESRNRYMGYVHRRLRREPHAYIVGKREFYKGEFNVSRAVLIPRPDTELLVETALQLVHGRKQRSQPIRILDVGTGSGAIAITLAGEIDDAEVIATDISPEALAVAEANAERLLTPDQRQRLNLLQGDLFTPVADETPFDLIVSNPPYIPSADLTTLQPEVRDYEPRLALDGGPDGLRVLARLIAEAPALLKSEGTLLLECGHDQDHALTQLMQAGFPGSYCFRRDLASINRCLVATMPVTKES